MCYFYFYLGKGLPLVIQYHPYIATLSKPPVSILIFYRLFLNLFEYILKIIAGLWIPDKG